MNNIFAFLAASKNGDIIEIKKCIRLCGTTDHKQCLGLAAHYGHIEAVKLLLANGWTVNHLDESNYAPLHYAADGGKSNMIAFLLEQGADLNLHRVGDYSSFSKDTAEEVADKVGKKKEFKRYYSIIQDDMVKIH